MSHRQKCTDTNLFCVPCNGFGYIIRLMDPVYVQVYWSERDFDTSVVAKEEACKSCGGTGVRWP